MTLNRFPLFFARQYKRSSTNHPYSQLTAAILLFFFLLSSVAANPQPDKFFLRISHGKSHDTNDLSVTSLGLLSLENNMVGHVDLSYLDSDKNGKALALDFGAGFAFNWYISPYISIGASLGYNWDLDETIAAYFPEVGIVLDITNSFGMNLSAKRYYSLYEEEEDIIMLGFVFRK